MARSGTHAGAAQPGLGLDPGDQANPWGVLDGYIDRVAEYVSTLTLKWTDGLAAFDVYVRDRCYAVEQSLRIDWRHSRRQP